MNLKKKKKGFTLIELMAVIAIIAILAAVLVPTVSGYIERSKKTAVITQVRNVVSAVETYNATAKSSDKLEVSTNPAKNPTLSEIREKVGADLLEAKSINKLPKTVTLGAMQAINEDTNAIKDIKLDRDGILYEYKNTDSQKAYKNTSDSLPFTPAE